MVPKGALRAGVVGQVSIDLGAPRPTYCVVRERTRKKQLWARSFPVGEPDKGTLARPYGSPTSGRVEGHGLKPLCPSTDD
jgi:hypothetical protein